MKQQRKKARKYVLINDKGAGVGCVVAAKDFKVKGPQIIRDWMRRHDCKTYEDVRTRMAFLEKHPGGTPQDHSKHATTQGPLTILEIIERTDGSSAQVQGRAVHYGWDSPGIFLTYSLPKYETSKMLKEAGVVSKKRKETFCAEVNFSRTEHCVKDSVQCVYYLQCLTHRVDTGTHTTIYKEDNSCYTISALAHVTDCYGHSSLAGAFTNTSNL